MSRTKSDGLDYFPLDVGFFRDERIRRLRTRFGADGPTLYLYILCRAFERGYYVEMNDDLTDDAADACKCSADKIGIMMQHLLSRSLLISISLNGITYITSHGIQRQYQESSKGRRREVEVDESLWILDESETAGFVKVRHDSDKYSIYTDKSGKKDDKSGKNETNKSKEKERKDTKETARAREDAWRQLIPTLDEVREYAAQIQSAADPSAFYHYYEAADWLDRNGMPVRNWKQKLAVWNTMNPGRPPADRGKQNKTFFDVGKDMKKR